MKKILSFMIFTVVGATTVEAKKPKCPIAKEGERWEFVTMLSDEFNEDEIDQKKWTNQFQSWGPWSWRDHLVTVGDGVLSVSTTYEPHQRDGRNLFYTSGILSSHETFTYGYMEARIKGCDLKNGACPAFWVRSVGKFAEPNSVDSVDYSEIDIVELQQLENMKHIDCNLHTIVMREGERIWVRPQQRPDLCQNIYMAEWDPREDYHVYAVENRPDSITWFIDGEKIAQQPNVYWHLPMNTAFSMGLRPPLIKYVDGDRIPNVENSKDNNFTTSMTVDYVRTWRQKGRKTKKLISAN